jgi:ubiquinone/menaquinone biosynthesis C-methylase UbiE
VLEDLHGLLKELRRILKPGGRLFLTSVVLTDRWRDLYLRLLSRRGVMARPRRAEDVLQSVRTVLGTEPEYHLIGSMLFVETASPPGAEAFRGMR